MRYIRQKKEVRICNKAETTSVIIFSGNRYCSPIVVEIREVKIHPRPPQKKTGCNRKAWSWTHRKSKCLEDKCFSVAQQFNPLTGGVGKTVRRSDHLDKLNTVTLQCMSTGSASSLVLTTFTN